MRFLPTCALLLSLSAIPGFCQSSSSTVMPTSANDSSVNYSALREKLAVQNKTLQDQVTNQRAIVKKNQILLKEAQKLDVSNKKLMEEKKAPGNGKCRSRETAPDSEVFAERRSKRGDEPVSFRRAG